VVCKLGRTLAVLGDPFGGRVASILFPTRESNCA
jgi:hypothetical protein